ncbi:MAG: DUF1214 domain-containing protein [Pseudomonadota bacterium]
MTMKSILIWMSAGVIGAILGTISALLIAGLLPIGPKLGGAVAINNWTSDWSIGSEAANPYVRARVARHGLLALAKEEAVYFTRTTDDDGEPLREACAYRVKGATFPAEWWSITLYDGDSRLPMNDDERLSFDWTQANMAFGDGNEWLFDVRSAGLGDDTTPWVSSKNAGEFDLMLRLYRPSSELIAEPESTLTPPSIRRLSCDGDVS